MVITKIIDGPSKKQLMDSFLHDCSDTQYKVDFTTEDSFKYIGNTITGNINSLTYEDGSGFSFSFRGHFNGNQYLIGYYNTRSRTGWIEVKTLPIR